MTDDSAPAGGPRLGWFPVLLAAALVAMSAWVVYEWATMTDPTATEDRSP